MRADARELEQQLCAHARCVRGLASALLADAAAADDVAQEALLAAWRQPPREPSALRAFLLQITRNLARRWQRASARRQRREQAAARSEHQPGPASEHGEMLSAIAAEVAALPPPLREVVLLRHYDDLPPRRIAERLGVGVEAVESRLRRAHAQLAARLRARFGNGLRAGLVAFAVPGHVAAPLVGALAMSTKSKSPLAAIAAVILLCGVVYVALGPALGVPVPGPQSVHAVAQQEQQSSPEGTAVEHRESVTAPAAATERPAGPSIWTMKLRGRVVDERRLPVAGAEVAAQTCGGSRVLGRSDSDGRFALALAADAEWQCQGEIAARLDDRCGIGTFWASPSKTERDVGTIALAPAGSVRVAVRRGGAPESGARVVVRRAKVLAGMRWEGTTGADGTVTLRGVEPERACVGVAAGDGAFAARAIDVAAKQVSNVDLDLADAIAVAVQVGSRADRTPIADARVLAWLYERLEGGVVANLPLHEVLPLPRTDAEGRAVLRGLLRETTVFVGAEHPDWQSVGVFSPPSWADLTAPAPRVELWLDGAATARWRLVAGEVAVPDDGTTFAIGHQLDMPIHRATLRDGVLELDRARPTGLPLSAWGPGCVASLRWPEADESGPIDAELRPTRTLVVEVRDPMGSPLAGVPLRVTAGPPRSARTGDDGRAVVGDLPADTAVVTLVSLLASQELGRADLQRGDGLVNAVLGPARSVRARVTVDGRPGLPGTLTLCSPNGHVADVHEDAERGVVTCIYWQHRSEAPGELRLYASWRQSIGVAMLPPGNGPAEVEFDLFSHGAATIDLVPPADGLSQILVERAYGPEPGQTAVWTHMQPGAGAELPRLTNLRPGRFRLRDGLSEVRGPWVEVTAEGGDARLQLDLAAVVEVLGTVVAQGGALDRAAVEVRDAAGTVVRSAPVAASGTFKLRVAIDRGGLAIVAVRDGRSSPPVAVGGAMRDVQLVLPQ